MWVRGVAAQAFSATYWVGLQKLARVNAAIAGRRCLASSSGGAFKTSLRYRQGSFFSGPGQALHVEEGRHTRKHRQKAGCVHNLQGPIRPRGMHQESVEPHAGITMEQLKSLNPDANLSKLTDGQTILLPSGKLSARDKVLGTNVQDVLRHRSAHATRPNVKLSLSSCTAHPTGDPGRHWSRVPLVSCTRRRDYSGHHLQAPHYHG